MEKKNFLAKGIFIISFITIFILPSFTPISFAATYNLSFATFRPPADPFAKPWLMAMAEELKERTNGQVKLTIHWAQALGKGRDQFLMVRDGVADMTDFPGVWLPGKFTLSEVASLPLAANDNLNVVKAMGILAGKGYFDRQWGEVEVLGWMVTPPLDIIFRKIKPETVEDMAGLKARASGGYISDFIKALKMVPVKVLPPDAYMAWQTGVVDAWVHPPSSMVKYKFIELPTRCVLDANISVIGNAAKIMNKKKFASLPPDIQKTIREVASKYCEVYANLGVETDEDTLKKLKEAKIEVYQLPPPEIKKMKAKALPIWEKYIADTEAKGLPGREVAAEFVRILRQLGEDPPYNP
jgi:TRAP-type C4-dicarboxylate transport system substrate-binding protein